LASSAVAKVRQGTLLRISAYPAKIEKFPARFYWEFLAGPSAKLLKKRQFMTFHTGEFGHIKQDLHEIPC